MKKFAFVFPGQGSQSVGMLDGWGDHPVVAQTVQEASDALGENIGLLIKDRKTGGTLFYAPGLGKVSDELLETMRQADCLLVDGTLWRDDEMLVREVGTKLGSEMGHLQQSGPGGMIEVLDGMPAVRKILIHINNTNPILDEDSVEREILGEHGNEVSFDGMNIEL